MVKITTITTPNITNPSYLFKEMLNHEESFNAVTDVMPLVETILSRLNQHYITFDHLRYSFSLIHKKFLPYSNETFLLLRKIVKDGVP